jgi:DNA-binding MarR family transcriptional regulator
VSDRKVLESASRHLNSGAIHLLRAMRLVDKEAGLTPARLSALSVLVFGGPQPLGRLAETEGVAGPTMTRIVDGLVELGLAAREPHPHNRRMSLVSATESGERLMRRAADRRLAQIQAALRSLPATEREALVAAAPALVHLSEVVREQLA